MGRIRRNLPSADSAAFDICHPDNHRPPWIERQILKAMARTEFAYSRIHWVCKNSPAGHISRRPQRRPQCEEQQRARVSSSLIVLVYGELPQQGCRKRVRLVALAGLRQASSLDLRCAERYVAHDLSVR